MKGDIQVRLILGHDLAGNAVAAWLHADPTTQVAVADTGAWRWS